MTRELPLIPLRFYSALKRLVPRLSVVLGMEEVRNIVLIGSVAKGNPRRCSDIDIVLVIYDEYKLYDLSPGEIESYLLEDIPVEELIPVQIILKHYGKLYEEGNTMSRIILETGILLGGEEL